MKNSSSFIKVLLVLSLMVSNVTVNSQTRINFNGLWRTREDVLVHITDSGSNIIVKYVNPGDCPTGHNCTLGGGSPYYLKGTVSSTNKMELTMMRCTHKKDMRDEGMADHWFSKCKVTSATNQSISGTWRTEWYQNDTRPDGKEYNFRRDPTGDGDSPFGLTRTNCKEELEKIVAEIDLKADINEQLKSSRTDVDANFDAAADEWRAEFREQLKEEVFQGVVPPSIKVVPGVYEQDPGNYIESWADFLVEVAEKGGNWTLEKAGKIVLLWDLFIDWTNLGAKGVVTLDELDQMNSGLDDMDKRRMENFRSWANARLEYEKLRQLCSAEIPRDEQPQPKIIFGPMDEKDQREFERAHEETDKAYKRTSSAIQSAKTELTKTASAVQALKQLVEPYKNADPNKTMQAVMTDAGIKKLQNGFIEAGKHWINVLKQLKAIDEERKKIKALSYPGVG